MFGGKRNREVINDRSSWGGVSDGGSRERTKNLQVLHMVLQRVPSLSCECLSCVVSSRLFEPFLWFWSTSNGICTASDSISLINWFYNKNFIHNGAISIGVQRIWDKHDEMRKQEGHIIINWSEWVLKHFERCWTCQLICSAPCTMICLTVL